MEDAYGPNTFPNWGDIHTVYFKNDIFTNTKLSCVTNREIAQVGGGTYTVMAMFVSAQMQTTDGPSYRQLVDLSGQESDQFVLPLGQSGSWLSPYYDNMLSLWQAGRYLEMKRHGYESQVLHTLMLDRQPAV